jgi:hypothetical protein
MPKNSTAEWNSPTFFSVTTHLEADFMRKKDYFNAKAVVQIWVIFMEPFGSGSFLFQDAN